MERKERKKERERERTYLELREIVFFLFSLSSFKFSLFSFFLLNVLEIVFG